MLSGLDLLIIGAIKGGISYIFTPMGFMKFAIIGGLGGRMVAEAISILKTKSPHIESNKLSR